jgi:hypothetical protein
MPSASQSAPTDKGDTTKAGLTGLTTSHYKHQGATAVASATAPAAIGDSAKSELDSASANLDNYESQIRRSLKNGGSKPVSVSGEAIGRIIGSGYSKYPEWMTGDNTSFRNSLGTIRLNLIAAPNRSLRLWSQMAFNHALLGENKATATVLGSDGSVDTVETTLGNGFVRSTSTGELGVRLGSMVFDDLKAGVTAKIGPTTWGFKAGGILWNCLSPLTVWKMQTRTFAWDYLPYEIEQPVATYYDYATVKGERTGRAAWNNRAFQGMQLESVDLPAGLYWNSFFGFTEASHRSSNWVIPSDDNTQLQYTNPDNTGVYRTYATKATGIGDNYRWSYFGQLAKSDLPGGVGVSGQFYGVYTDPNYGRQWSNGIWSGYSDLYQIQAQNKSGAYMNNYWVSPKVGSVNIKRELPGGLGFDLDVAVSNADTTFYRVYGDGIKSATADSVVVKKYGSRFASKVKAVDYGEEIGTASTGIVPAAYLDLKYPFALFDAELRTVAAPKNFTSPASAVNNIDAIFPYESNMVGAGKFAGNDNGVAYASNLAGTNLLIKPAIPGGHATASWGLHGQMESGKDMIYFPWRQNGYAYNQSLALGADKTFDQGLLDDIQRNAGTSIYQNRRLGDEYYNDSARHNPYSSSLGDVGGERGAYLSTYEGFMAYTVADSQAIKDNFYNGTAKSSQKYTQNLSFDAAYNLAQLWNGKRAVYAAGYVAFNSVTKTPNAGIPAFSASSDDVLLMGRNIRFEPVVQVTPKFYLIGLVSNEIWKSKYGVAYVDKSTGKAISLSSSNISKYTDHLVSAPIDYNDWIYGLGFDWDMAERVQLHVRCQYFTHEDKGISSEVSSLAGTNDYKAWLTMAEVKMWF